MKARMQEVLGLLTLVVERVTAANARTEQAENRAAEMGVLLDAFSKENAALCAELDQAEDAAVRYRQTIRLLRGEVDALTTRVAGVELRIHLAADALGLPAPADLAGPIGDEAHASMALH